MADTVTVNYSFVQPEVGSSNDSWGGKLNTNWETLDTTLKAVSDAAAAADDAASAALPATSYTAADILTKIKTVDGDGSGLDADRLGGSAKSAFVLAANYTAADVIAKFKSVPTAGSGTDSDKLDGQEGSYYANIPARLGYTPLNAAGGTATGTMNFAAANFSGNVTGTNITLSGNLTSSSDETLKNNIQELDGLLMLEALSEVGGVSYVLKETGSPTMGVIAQRLIAAGLGDLVGNRQDGTLTVNYMGLIGPVIAAINTLADRVQELERLNDVAE